MPIRFPRLTLEDGDRIALAELHNRLLPIRAVARRLPHAAELSPLLRRPHAGDLHAEELLDGLPDLRLGSVGMDLERVLGAILIGGRRLLGDVRTDDRAIERRHGLLASL